MSDFSDRPFVAGSLVGLRTFEADKLGRLTGPTYPAIFTPDENVGTCYRGSGMALTTWQLDALTARLHHRTPPRMPMLEANANKAHQVGAAGCNCGYYAYFDGKNDLHNQNRVAAIVEGYGTCTVGSRGFRAEKARLLALVLPRKVVGLKVWGGRRLSYFWSTLFLADSWGIYRSASEGHWWSLGLNISATLMAAAYIAFGLTKKEDAKHDLIRRNYPGVKVYRSKRAALKAFPLTPPPLPTPETEPKFWEVPA